MITISALGSVTATVNQSAQVVNSYRYKPFGALLAKTGTGPDPAFGWVGTKGYRPSRQNFSDFYVRARHYDSATGRWPNVDPIGFAVGYVSHYVYVTNSTVNLIDPTGLLPLVGKNCPPDLAKKIKDMISQICGKLPTYGDPHNQYGGKGMLACMQSWCSNPTAVVDCYSKPGAGCSAGCGLSFGGPDTPGYKGPGWNPQGKGFPGIYICSDYLRSANCKNVGLCDSMLHELSGNCGSSHKGNDGSSGSIGPLPIVTDPCEKRSRIVCKDLGLPFPDPKTGKSGA